MRYDPYSRPVMEDPYPIYKWMRDNQPCYYDEERDFYALFRFEDCWQATLDYQTYSSTHGPMIEMRADVGDGLSIIGMDPPRHVILRNLVSKGFTPRRIAALEEEIRGITKEYLDRYAGSGGFDIQKAFNVRLPMDVISVLLGIPAEYRDAIREGSDLMLYRDPETGEMHPDAPATVARSREIVVGLLNERRKKPQDDLLSILANVEYTDLDGETRKLNDTQVLGFFNLLSAAGHETTAKLIGNCIVLFARHPDQRELLWREPERIPNAIEEVLRFEAPSQYQGRNALEEKSWHGVTIPVGAKLAVVTGAACRDEREFDDPDRFDVTREADRQFYFGVGHHVCVGKSLARLETRVALEEIAARFPNYEVNEDELVRTYQAHVRGFASVPIHF